MSRARRGWPAAILRLAPVRPAARLARTIAGLAVRRDGVARRGSSDRGSATVELAVSLPALVLLLSVALTAVMAVRTQLECVDAAREAARAAARGESGPAAGQRAAPSGASVNVTTAGGNVHATVRVRFNPLGQRLPGFDISASAVAATEPGVGE